MINRLLVIWLIGTWNFIPGQSQVMVDGIIQLDTSWNRTIYISEVASLYGMYQCSEDMIIGMAPINENGEWQLEISDSGVEKLFRLHVTKKGFPPASLIIGGKEQNHGFLALGKDRSLVYDPYISDQILPDFNSQDHLNLLMQQVQNIIIKWDNIDKNTSDQQEKMAVRQAAISELVSFADTCSNLLPALYAIHMSDEGFNKHEVYTGMNKLKGRFGYHPYFNDFPSLESKSYFFEYLLLAGILIVIGWIFFRLRMIKKIERMGQLFHSLSQREREVFQLVKSGKTNKEIAMELNVEISTIKSHVNSIFNKLKIRSRKDVHLYQ